MRLETGDKVRVKSRKVMAKRDYIVDVIYELAETEQTVRCMRDNGKVEIMHYDGYYDNEIFQLILESPKLKLRLSQKGLKLKIKILEQDESLINNLNIECGKCFLISEYSPELYNGCMLFIKGDYENSNNNKTSYEYESQEKLDEFILALRVMMKDERLQ